MNDSAARMIAQLESRVRKLENARNTSRRVSLSPISTPSRDSLQILDDFDRTPSTSKAVKNVKKIPKNWTTPIMAKVPTKPKKRNRELENLTKTYGMKPAIQPKGRNAGKIIQKKPPQKLEKATCDTHFRSTRTAKVPSVNEQRQNDNNANLEKVHILYGNMPDKMQQKAISCARAAIQSCKSDVDVALALQREFDQVYGFYWHAIVGRHYGSAVHHNFNRHMDFLIGNVGFLLYQTD